MEGNEDEMFLNYETCIRTYEETKSLIPAGNLHEVRFEDLELDPLGEVAQTYKALGLTSWASVEPLNQTGIAETYGLQEELVPHGQRVNAKSLRAGEVGF
jgi:hypothetical protein